MRCEVQVYSHSLLSFLLSSIELVSSQSIQFTPQQSRTNKIHLSFDWTEWINFLIIPSSSYKSSIVYCSGFILDSTLSWWNLGDAVEKYFRCKVYNFCMTRRRKCLRCWCGPGTAERDRLPTLSTLLLLKSILATERSRISRSLLVPVTSHHHILLLSLWEDSTWASDWVSRCYNFDCKTRTLQRERQRMISSVSPWKSQAQSTNLRQSRNDARKFPPDLPYIFVRIYLDLISDYNPYFQSKHF